MSDGLIADMADRAVEALLMRCHTMVIVDGLGASTSFGSDVAAEVARRAKAARPATPEGWSAMAYDGMERDLAPGVIDKLADCKEFIVVDRDGETSYERKVAAEVARIANAGLSHERILKEIDKVKDVLSDAVHPDVIIDSDEHELAEQKAINANTRFVLVDLMRVAATAFSGKEKDREVLSDLLFDLRERFNNGEFD